MTNDEWLETVDEHWNNLLTLIAKYHPNSTSFRRFDESLITAPAAENACEMARKEIQAKSDGMPMTVVAAQVKLAGDVDALLDIFNSTWFGMP